MPENAITAWITQLRDGDPLAAQHLWNTYFHRLTAIARQKLRGRYALIGDEEDVALSAFKSFCRGLEQGQFDQLEGRDDLWNLLLTITLHKALHLLRDESREKRGGGFQRIGNGAKASGFDWQQLVAAEPSPELAMQVSEQAERLLASLNDSQLVELAVLKMEGHTNEEIAKHWHKSERTVERKLSLIRKIWTHSSAET